MSTHTLPFAASSSSSSSFSSSSTFSSSTRPSRQPPIVGQQLNSNFQLRPSPYRSHIPVAASSTHIYPSHPYTSSSFSSQSLSSHPTSLTGSISQFVGDEFPSHRLSSNHLHQQQSPAVTALQSHESKDRVDALEENKYPSLNLSSNQPYFSNHLDDSMNKNNAASDTSPDAKPAQTPAFNAVNPFQSSHAEDLTYDTPDPYIEVSDLLRIQQFEDYNQLLALVRRLQDMVRRMQEAPPRHIIHEASQMLITAGRLWIWNRKNEIAVTLRGWIDVLAAVQKVVCDMMALAFVARYHPNGAQSMTAKEFEQQMKVNILTGQTVMKAKASSDKVTAKSQLIADIDAESLFQTATECMRTMKSKGMEVQPEIEWMIQHSSARLAMALNQHETALERFAQAVEDVIVPNLEFMQNIALAARREIFNHATVIKGLADETGGGYEQALRWIQLVR